MAIADGVDTVQAKLVQKRLLIPLTLVLMLLLGGFSAVIIKLDRISDNKLSQDLLDNSIKILNDSLAEHSDTLAALAKIIVRNENLRDAFRDQDRQRLFVLSEDIFLLLKQELSITHFYFHRSDRINLLRVHKPEKHGDFIDRFTAVEAERTQKIASGIELGPLGTFTLRTVLPVLEGDNLIGYLELGKEIEDVLARIHENQETELAVTINKEFLNKKTWKEGMTMLGRNAEWNRFSDDVLIYHSQPSYPAEFNKLVEDHSGDRVVSYRMNFKGKLWHGMIYPLSDVSGTEVGRLIICYDHTQQHAFFLILIKKLAWGVVILLVALFTYLWFILRRTDRIILIQHTRLVDSRVELEKAHKEMKKLATTDALTGIANRRFAMQTLEQLWPQSDSDEKPVACLLIDADGFKTINDTYGHDAGDFVLFELAKHLCHSVRTDDIVCRLGGDEFLIICPNTDKDGLLNIANQIHSRIADLTVPVSGGAWHGSISVGAAVRTSLMERPEDLVKAADKGVYRAKKDGKNCVRMV